MINPPSKLVLNFENRFNYKKYGLFMNDILRALPFLRKN